MSRALNWDKVNRAKRFEHPSTKPTKRKLRKRERPTAKQLAYLAVLRDRAGIEGAAEPRTRQEASDAIDHLKLGVAPIETQLATVDESVKARAR